MKDIILQNPDGSLNKIRGICKGDYAFPSLVATAKTYAQAAQDVLASINKYSTEIEKKQLEKYSKIREASYEIIFTACDYILTRKSQQVDRDFAVETLLALADYECYQKEYKRGLGIILNSIGLQIDEIFDCVIYDLNNELPKSSFGKFINNYLGENKILDVTKLRQAFYKAITSNDRTKLINSFIENFDGYLRSSMPALRALVANYNHYYNLLNITIYTEVKPKKPAFLQNHSEFLVKPKECSEATIIQAETAKQTDKRKADSLRRKIEIDETNVAPPPKQTSRAMAQKLTSQQGPLAPSRKIGAKIAEIRDNLSKQGLIDNQTLLPRTKCTR
jgi:hypothetical protein